LGGSPGRWPRQRELRLSLRTQRQKPPGPSSPSKVKEMLALCDGVSTWLNSASIEGRNDGLWEIHIPRRRHRRCDDPRTHRGRERRLRPGGLYRHLVVDPFRRVSFHKPRSTSFCLSALTPA